HCNKSESRGGSSSSYKDDSKDPKQFVGVDTNKSRIVYVASSADLEEEFLYACHYYGKINSKAQVESDSLVGDDTKIDERTSIKRSTI
ncbi:17897_t:CDS:2, partial [Gigaspora rosea]